MVVFQAATLVMQKSVEFTGKPRRDSVEFGLDSVSAFPPFAPFLLHHLLLFFGASAADAVGDIGVAVVGILRGFVIGDI